MGCKHLENESLHVKKSVGYENWHKMKCHWVKSDFTSGIYITVLTLAKTEIIFPKNVGALVAMNFT